MRELDKNLIKPKSEPKFGIVSMTEDFVEIVKDLEIESGLSSWTTEDYRNELTRDDSIFIVAVCSDAIVGFAVARMRAFSHNERDKCEFKEVDLFNIAVKTEFRNFGIGQSLLSYLLNKAGVHGVSTVWLEVRESNNIAISFYKKNGFIPGFVRNKFYTLPLENAVVMKLDCFGQSQIDDN